MTFWLQFIAVFVSLVIVDICWARYMAHANAGNPAKAGMWSALIMVGGAYVTVSYVDDHRLFLAAVLGAFCGTFVAVRWGKKDAP